MKNHWRMAAAMLPRPLEKAVYRRHFLGQHDAWLKDNNQGPVSHLFKQKLIRKTALENRLDVLVETGTYLGDMVFAMQASFTKIISVELSQHFYRKAVQRFRKYKNVALLQGDSGAVLKEVVPGLTGPALFWLDGHYSGGKTAKGSKSCPIYEELTSVLSSVHSHVVLIDDARLFVGEDDYPTLDELKAFVLKFKPETIIELNGDVFVLTLNAKHV